MKALVSCTRISTGGFSSASLGLQALTSHKRGRKSQGAQVEELAELQGENQRLRARLQQAELIIEVQKKLSQLLGLSTPKIGGTGSE